VQRSDGWWDGPPGPLSEWIGEWASHWWSLRPRPPQPKQDIADEIAATNPRPIAKTYQRINNLPKKKKQGCV
jgi:hypothetical protein